MPEQLSVPTGAVYVTTALHWPEVALVLTLAGHVIAGAWLSTTVTVKLHVAVVPLDAVTLKVLVVTPTGKAAPLARPLVLKVVWPVQLSVPTGAV